MMQYEQGSAQPVWTRKVNAVRPATPGSIVAPQLPSPSPNRSALVTPRSLISSMKRALSVLRITRTTLGSAAISSGRLVA
jgi:hypothetical protein